jgi:hypothetical protein
MKIFNALALTVSDTEMREFEKDCFVSDTDSARKTSEPQETGGHNPATA